MVREDAEGDVSLLLLGESHVRRRDGAGVGLAGERGQFVEGRLEDVGVVVRRLRGEVGEALARGVDAGDALEAHAGVHVLGGERRESAVGVGVELDEDVVPDLDAAGAAGVDERAAGGLVIGGQEVEMDLGARTAGTGVAHHPEIVLLVAVDDVDLRVEPGGGEEAGPDVVGFLVEVRGIALGLVGRVNSREEPLRRDAPDLGQQFPAPGERVLFEVIAEGPVAEHLEERVVVGVVADVLEVVVFPAGADAFLGVGDALPGCDLVAEEIGHELVHAGVRKQQVGRGRQQ